MSDKSDSAVDGHEKVLLDVLRKMNFIAHRCGASLRRPETLFPLSSDGAAFDRGVKSCLAHIYFELGNSLEGRQAALDLGFRPLFQDVKRPVSAVDPEQIQTKKPAPEGVDYAAESGDKV